MKWAWLLAVILAALAVIYMLAPVDFAGGADEGAVAPAPEATPPSGSEGGAAGRALAPPTIYAFFGWGARGGDYRGGKVFDAREKCEAAHDDDVMKFSSRMIFSACIAVQAAREIL